MENFILKITDLTKHYNHGFTLHIPYLRFEEGKIYAVVGPNGAGKTTLLTILSLLEKPTRGTIFYRNCEIANTHSSPLNIRWKMSIVMENPYLFRTSVFKNIAYGLKVRHFDKKYICAAVTEALKMVRLDGYENRKTYRLSRGETQRVAIARALVLKPEILFLDEPFTNIDQKNVDILENIIRDIKKYPMTVIFTTHDLLQAHRLADKVISLFEGHLVKGSLENLFYGHIESKGKQKWVNLSPTVKVNVLTDKTGPVHITIAPQDIILSKYRLDSSARNSFQGSIKKIEIEGGKVWVSVDVGVKFTAVITRASLEKLNLAIGHNVFLAFKTTAVTVF